MRSMGQLSAKRVLIADRLLTARTPPFDTKPSKLSTGMPAEPIGPAGPGSQRFFPLLPLAFQPFDVFWSTAIRIKKWPDRPDRPWQTGLQHGTTAQPWSPATMRLARLCRYRPVAEIGPMRARLRGKICLDSRADTRHGFLTGRSAIAAEKALPLPPRSPETPHQRMQDAMSVGNGMISSCRYNTKSKAAAGPRAIWCRSLDRGHREQGVVRVRTVVCSDRAG